MISRRNFFSIITMMAVLLFLYVASQMLKVTGNNYEVNEYATDAPAIGSNRWMMESVREEEKRNIILFCGREESELADMVEQWCTYNKKKMEVLPDTEYDVSTGILPKVLLVDTSYIDVNAELKNMKKLAQAGINIVFCNLPSVSEIRQSRELQEFLGILEVRSDAVEVEGIHLYKGFLLGGEAIYKAETKEEKKQQDLELEMPWYITGTGTKSYMAGMLDEDMVEREELPKIIWRNSLEEAMVFVVNGDYLSDMSGWGILDAMMYEMNTYTLYPVVNAQNMLVTDCPILAPENTRRMEELYSRDLKAVMRDVMWPGIVSMSMNNNLKLTCYMNTKYNYIDDAQPVADDVVFYLQQMREIDAEVGKSLSYGDGITLQEKLQRDNAFYEGLNIPYQFATLYTEKLSGDADKLLQENVNLDGVQSIACLEREEKPLLSYYKDAVTVQGVTNKAQDYTYSADLRLRSLMTALAYSNVLISMDNVVWPESKEDQWEKYFDKIYSNVSTYWSGFESFDRTTMSESDTRVRAFLNLDYEEIRIEDTIYLKVSGIERDAWFMFRTHGEDITEIKNAQYEEIEEDTYLIHTYSKDIEIQLEKGMGVLKSPWEIEY